VRRWGLVIALLLSLGVNAGILTILLLHRADARKAQRPAADRAQPPGNPGNPGNPGGQDGTPQRVIRLADLLGLEGDQRRRFISLQTGFFVETVRLRTEQSEIHRELRHALIAPHPDRARVDKLLHDSAGIFLALEQALAKNVVDSRALLNPAQEKRYLEIIRRLRPNAGGVWGAPNQQRNQQRRQARRQERDRLDDTPPPR